MKYAKTIFGLAIICFSGNIIAMSSMQPHTPERIINRLQIENANLRANQAELEQQVEELKNIITALTNPSSS
ncbi:hypothetical protein KAU11_04560 [Candidatus Babeliales bacterium]|nr:hypothetical protein [Candidatus Babeliales bacterium]